MFILSCYLYISMNAPRRASLKPQAEQLYMCCKKKDTYIYTYVYIQKKIITCCRYTARYACKVCIPRYEWMLMYTFIYTYIYVCILTYPYQKAACARCWKSWSTHCLTRTSVSRRSTMYIYICLIRIVYNICITEFIFAYLQMHHFASEQMFFAASATAHAQWEM